MLPTETYFTSQHELYNGEAIQLFHEAAAHSDGDSIVFFRRSDVISTGDIFSTVAYPRVNAAAGGTVDGVISALNHIIDLAIPRDKQEGGTYIVPGHGRVCDEADVVEYRDMLVIIRDRVRDLVMKGRSLDQIKGAKVTFDYDRRYATSWMDRRSAGRVDHGHPATASAEFTGRRPRRPITISARMFRLRGPDVGRSVMVGCPLASNMLAMTRAATARESEVRIILPDTPSSR